MYVYRIMCNSKEMELDDPAAVAVLVKILVRAGIHELTIKKEVKNDA